MNIVILKFDMGQSVSCETQTQAIGTLPYIEKKLSEHDITGLYHGSLHQSNLKGYKVIGFLNTSQHGGDFTDCLYRCC